MEVEQPTDITVSNAVDPHDVTADLTDGYAIFRERTVIHCPICKQRYGFLSSYMRVIPGSVTTNIKFTPDKKPDENKTVS
jgi:hypothetical protein